MRIFAAAVLAKWAANRAANRSRAAVFSVISVNHSSIVSRISFLLMLSVFYPLNTA
jgi:hypothetical protein